MKQRKKTILTLLLIILPLLLAGVGLLVVSLTDQQTKMPVEVVLSDVWQEVYELYQKDDYQGAEAKLFPHWRDFPELENGCELMVSVFAEAKNIEFLEQASKKCIEMQKGGDTIIEGLAYSLSFQGKVNEGIEQLEALRAKQSSPRLLVALSRLQLMLGRDEQARRIYLDAIADADVWSMWVSYALKVPIFVENQEFLEEVIRIVVSKPHVHEQVEMQLLAKANKLKDKLAYKQLAKRLGHKHMHNS
ncbi:MAG: hypothetical protein HRU09_02445 [Oligoflexales bacterium]|nr:hypothetical protein [Oligoflexales bacterium]